MNGLALLLSGPVLVIGLMAGCTKAEESDGEMESNTGMEMEEILGPEGVARLASLPLDCIEKPYPYKSGLVIEKESDLQLPKVHHPAFYGCFDWHSSVHGHWSLVWLLRSYPDMPMADSIRAALGRNLTKENLDREIEYFSLNRQTPSFERTYGWAWLLQLTLELRAWDDPDGRIWNENLRPLAELIADKYAEYLPKLNYAIRVGEHSNTAFGLTFAYDYAVQTGRDSLAEMIRDRCRYWYLGDAECPVTWEPSGYDFLSPCLEEADIMRRILTKEEFRTWFSNFLPRLEKGNAGILKPAVVSDRSDGKLVHLDGLNFSRAWCLYGIAADYPEWAHLRELADEHVRFSLPNIVEDDYAGGHWLGTFALYAISQREIAYSAK